MAGIVEKVGRRIRDLRASRGLSQAALAERAALATHTISRIERGQQGPSLDALERIAAALGVPLPEMLNFDGAPGQAIDPVDALLDQLPQDANALRERLRDALRVLAGK